METLFRWNQQIVNSAIKIKKSSYFICIFSTYKLFIQKMSFKQSASAPALNLLNLLFASGRKQDDTATWIFKKHYDDSYRDDHNL